MEKESLPLVKAAFKRQFEKAMLFAGVDADYYFSSVGLPAGIVEDPNALLPEKPFWHLINMVAVQEKLPDFGAQVARIMPWHRVESLAPVFNGCKTLKDVLNNFCEAVPSQSSQAGFYIEEDSDRCWFTYSATPLISNDIQMEMYRISCMIQLVQLAASSSWYPQAVELITSKKTQVNKNPFIKKSKISFSCKTSRISIANHMLDLPVDCKHTAQSAGFSSEVIEKEFLFSINQLIRSYIEQNICKEETVAKVIGLPVRTLQRRLEKFDVSFNDLVGRVKYELATDKLINTDLAVADIGYQLDYSDPAHFSRAFKRWSGMSPASFRKSSKQ